ncbi:anthranilate synthase family protein [Mumia sp. zg.B17]|uniref:anthranilate synthase family protein n=1 Tax=unclassified Mumia TaxID=2621872 RepID=UPI001C6EC37A|nr:MULTISPECIES: anthranilate synthase family protein [unclassified Mumia]MBW9204318.1 anthranilate synthase family protein [Mumia sp. zg.B17]MBW9209697.1 anthranilate synthase family protein [Mumia sp. zg.B21]MDD9348020.1 anthranilate synthase family protein [Mumia sp.]
MPSPHDSAAETAAALEQLMALPSYAIIRVRDSDRVVLIGGARTDVDSLMDVPLSDPVDGAPASYDSLVLVPYRQVRERGFEAHDDGTPLSVIAAETSTDVALDELLAVLPDGELAPADKGGFETDDATYAEMVRTVIDAEIGQGEGANLVIGRHYRARLADWGPAAALTVLRRLLERERGAHWTFLVFTGDRYLIGASPERHVSVDAGQVRMNPISGTFRLRGLESQADRKRELLRFLGDEKEIYELFMVVDEELKMMCDICSEGGLVLGPYLKPMTHLVHTEYLLAGRTHRDVREVLRDSMFAATVTGSPVENACRLITKYEQEGRGYYAAAAALLGRDAQGRPTADSPILIRTADVDLEGNLTVTAGATLVRDSDPDHETAETHAKAAGVLSAFGLVPAAPAPIEGFDAFAHDDEVLIALGSRNQRLSQFWLSDQSDTAPADSLAGTRAVVLDNEDDFVNMLSHLLGVLGISTDVVRHEDYDGPETFDGYDLVVIGPGPGDPRDLDDPKIATVRRAVDDLLETGRRFLAVCLGHQVLCGALGLDLAYKDIVFQGTQSALPLRGRTETVGFYNTFVAREPGDGLPDRVTVEVDPVSGDVHTVAGPTFRGIQFHAESILTQHGDRVIGELVSELLG